MSLARALGTTSKLTGCSQFIRKLYYHIRLECEDEEELKNLSS
jgi:hypothetical protein